jgi:hypothetical protein
MVGVPNYFSTSASCFDSWVGAGIYAVQPSYSSRTNFQRRRLLLSFTSEVLSCHQTCQSYRSNRLPLCWCHITRVISVRSCLRCDSDTDPIPNVSYGCSFIGGQHSDNYNTAAFRVPWVILMIPAIGLFFAIIFLPQSPRWLACKDLMCEFEQFNKDVMFLDLFAPAMLNRNTVAVFMQVWSQLTGMNVMNAAPPLSQIW